MYTNHAEFNTATGHETVPNAQPTPHQSASAHIHDPHIDTAAEARSMQDRLGKMDAELATLNPGGEKYRIAKLLRDSFAKQIPFTLARFRDIDAQRAKTAAMAATGLNAAAKGGR